MSRTSNMNKILLSLLLLIPLLCFSQNYTSYITGNVTDKVTNPNGGVCLMGGASEDDNAMKWFLQNANGGDVLVLRASGSDGYNTYLYSDLGIVLNSVETIVCNNALASDDLYVLQKIQQAEGIWFAGGDQWDYISFWRGTPVENAINQAITQRNIVIGGTSAGMAIQGKYYFSAQNGTVTSAEALDNPYDSSVTVDSTHFIENSFLNHTITDTHFDDPDRKGRLTAFLARIYADYGLFATAIACDEYTAVCIDMNGIATVYGGYPTYDDNAYFIQSNCELANQQPENCSVNSPLTWDLEGLAVKVYQVKGDDTATKTFNLNDWQSGEGGSWHAWSVVNGIFNEQNTTPVNCAPLSVMGTPDDLEIDFFPNPTSDKLTIMTHNHNFLVDSVSIFNNLGQRVYITTTSIENGIVADFADLDSGLYYVKVYGKYGELHHSVVVKK